MLKSIVGKLIHLKNGFSIIEILLVITIIGILTSIAVLNVSSTNVSARDSERSEDIKAIARQMEAKFEETLSGSETIASYPGTTEVSAALTELGPSSTRVPGVDDTEPSSLVTATNTSQSVTGVSPLPSKANDKYVYQPLKADGSLCIAAAGDPTLSCVKFNLFYFSEKESVVKKVTSRNQ